MFTRQKLIKWEPLLALGGLLLLGGLAYLLLAGRLGYYRDDWYMLWAMKTGGISRLFQMFKIDRPFMGLVSGVSYWLVGESPLAWQFYSFGLRILSAFGFLWLLRILWPERKVATLSAAALFIVYPGFFQQTNALTFSNHFISYGLSIFSVLFTLLAFRQNKWYWKWLLIGLSMGFAGAYLLIYEYMIGMEAVRILLIGFMVYRQGIRRFSQNIRRTIVQWLPSALPLAGFLAWRLFIFKSARYATDLGRLKDVYLQDPIGMGLRLIVEAIRDFFETAYLAWFVPLYRLTSQASASTLLVGLVVALLGIGVLAFFWFVIKAGSVQTTGESQPDDKVWLREMLLIGGLWMAFTILPVVLSERQVLFQTMLDRYTLHVTAGVAIFLIGNIYVLFQQTKLRYAFTALLVGIGLLTNYHNAVDFARFWEYQRQAWWQFSWRAPALKEGTALTLILPAGSRLAEGYETWAPANLIYQKDPDQLIVSAEVLNLETLQQINQPATIQRNMRTIIVTSDFKNSLAMSLNSRGCLHVYDRAWLGFPVNEEPMIQMVARNSNIGLLEVDQPANLPSEKIFGREPAHGWCYYYQKAALAAQQGDWQEVTRLGDEVTQLRLHPDPGYEMEWMPFYEGYLRLDDASKAEPLEQAILSSQDFVISFCGKNKSSQATASAVDDIRGEIIQTLCSGFE